MVRRSAVFIAVAATCLWAASITTASRPPANELVVGKAASSSLLPQVVCATTYGPIGQAKFAYRTRPRACLFHKPGTPVDEADLVAGSQLHWLQWDSTLAIGKGKSAQNMVGLVPMDVRLTHPLTICGHTVFSKAQFKFPTSKAGYGHPVALDRSLGSC